MKKLKALFLALLCSAPLAFAQTAMTSTTLSAAITSTATQFAVASATGISAANGTNAATYLYIDREYMAVQNISGTLVTVIRGVQGTQAAHNNAAKVWVGPASAFGQNDPSQGSCTSTNLAYQPVVVISTGNIWYCGNSIWNTGSDFTGKMSVGAQLTAAATLTLTNQIHHITSSATTVSTITATWLPATGGCVMLVPDASMTGMTTSSGGNIALATTSVANKVLQLCYDPGTSKWYPSY